MALVLKTSVSSRAPWVRIPPSPFFRQSPPLQSPVVDGVFCCAAGDLAKCRMKHRRHSRCRCSGQNLVQRCKRGSFKGTFQGTLRCLKLAISSKPSTKVLRPKKLASQSGNGATSFASEPSCRTKMGATARFSTAYRMHLFWKLWTSPLVSKFLQKKLHMPSLSRYR